MALTRRKLKARTKLKKQYLSYYRKARASGVSPSRILTYAQWVDRRKAGKGFSQQTKAQLRTLSKGDYEAIRKFFK